MKTFNVAILGCGTVGRGVAKILLEMKKELARKSGLNIELKKIVDLFPKKISQQHDIPIDLFCMSDRELKIEEANKCIEEIIKDDDIDLVVETIGGSNDFILNVVLDTIKSKKHLVTANKALLAIHGNIIFDEAEKNDVFLGYEASVCGAIPIIKTIKESFTGDEIISISGILNGTSNYILSKMKDEGIEFEEALKKAQENGYAEADPTLDINGGDAGHKLILLIKLAFGKGISFKDLSIEGIQNITKDDLDFADEMNCNIKLICFAERNGDKIFATVKPMMVKRSNFLAGINGATNAVQLINKYSGRHLLVGTGAGSLETASSIVADIVYAARNHNRILSFNNLSNFSLINSNKFLSSYNIIFETEDMPGITGFVTTAIGNQNINIDTVSHNRHNKDKAVFSIATMACTLEQINNAIDEIKKQRPNVLLNTPVVIPVFY